MSMSQSYDDSARYFGAARRIQGKWRTQRSQVVAGRRVTRFRRGVPRYLRTKGIRAFTMTATPFCMAFGQGTAASQGLNFYPINGVPAVVTYTNTTRFSLGFTLGSVQNYLNGGFVGSSAITNYTEYTQLFDSYRIRKVEISMFYNSNSSALGPGTSLPVISIANDYDDVGSTGLESLMQYESYRTIQFGNNTRNGLVKHQLKPKVQSLVETTAGTAIAMNPSNPWLDCNNGTVLYCGVKGNFDNMNIGSASTGFVTFYVKYFVEFKNTR